MTFHFSFSASFIRRKVQSNESATKWLVSFPRNSALVFTEAKLGSQQWQ